MLLLLSCLGIFVGDILFVLKGESLAKRYPRIYNLNWNLLKTFLVIVEEGSISRAADKLLLRQPSVTSALQKLEEALGCQLIQRASRRFALTSRGEILRDECKKLFQHIESIEEKLALDEESLTGQIRIMLVTHVVMPGLDNALRQLRRRYPLLSVRIEVADSQDIVRAVAQKQVPFGFCLLSKPLAALHCRFLMREEFGIYCGATHHLFGQQSVNLSRLREENFVSFTCGHGDSALEPMVALRDGAGLGARVAGISPNLEEVRRMIVAGLGIGILPVDVARSDIERQQLWRIPALDGDLGADLYLLTNPEIKFGAAEDAFLDLFKTSLFDAQET